MQIGVCACLCVHERIYINGRQHDKRGYMMINMPPHYAKHAVRYLLFRIVSILQEQKKLELITMYTLLKTRI